MKTMKEEDRSKSMKHRCCLEKLSEMASSYNPVTYFQRPS